MYIISVQKPTAICCQKSAFRLAQLEESAYAEREARDVTAQWYDHVNWDKVFTQVGGGLPYIGYIGMCCPIG